MPAHFMSSSSKKINDEKVTEGMPRVLEDLIKQSMCFSSLDKRQHIQHLELTQIMPPPDTGEFLYGIS